MAAVLLHARHPLSIVESCSRLADTLVITEVFHVGLDGPICRLHSTRENNAVRHLVGFQYAAGIDPSPKANQCR
jgi:hypothetical protein